jgi:DNA primase
MALGITDAVLDEIKSRVDIADLIESYGIAVKTAGSGKIACCPFHHEKTPSFHINSLRGFYHCFGCGESGDAIKFVQKMDGLTFVEAVKKLAESCSVRIEEKYDADAARRKRLYALMAELAQFYRRCLLQTREGGLARDYLASRDLGADVQESFLVGYAPRGMAPMVKWAEKHGYTVAELAAAGVVKAPESASDEGYHRFGGRLMFTVRDKQGRVVAFSGRQLVENKKSGKYVNSPETLIFRKSSVLFGFDKAAGNIAKSRHQEAIVCEGQIDTIRLHASETMALDALKVLVQDSEGNWKEVEHTTEGRYIIIPWSAQDVSVAICQGETSSPIPVIVAVCAAAAVLAGILFLRKKKPSAK